MAEEHDRNVQQAMRMIENFQSRQQDPAAAAPRRWTLGVENNWQLALEGTVVFGIAFVSGLGLGVLYDVIIGA